MKRGKLIRRLCSPVAASSAAAAVCLSGGGIAHAATGNLTVTNGKSFFATGSTFGVFSGQALFILDPYVLHGGPNTFVSAPAFLSPAYLRSTGFTVGPFQAAEVVNLFETVLLIN